MSENRYLLELQNAIAYIERNVCSDIDVKDICNVSVFSPWEFQRIFRAHIGDTIGNYLRGRRLTLAATDLQNNSSKRILDIAIEYQFSSQEAFARAFKKQFKFTPGQVRENRSKNLSGIKPILNSKRLLHIAQQIGKHPELKIIGPKKLMGRSRVIESTFGTDIENYELIKNHWRDFTTDIGGSRSPLVNKKYGLISGSNSDMNDENLRYFASIEVDQNFEIREGMEFVTLEKREYAVFEVRGGQRSCQVIADYIYGIWLPQSEFVRDEGYDFEVFEQNLFRLNDENSIIHYFLPVRVA